jgi:hypothetical protein
VPGVASTFLDGFFGAGEMTAARSVSAGDAGACVPLAGYDGRARENCEGDASGVSCLGILGGVEDL